MPVDDIEPPLGLRKAKVGEQIEDDRRHDDDQRLRETVRATRDTAQTTAAHFIEAASPMSKPARRSRPRAIAQQPASSSAAITVSNCWCSSDATTQRSESSSPSQ